MVRLVIGRKAIALAVALAIPRYAGQPLLPSRNPPAIMDELLPIARQLGAAMK